MERCKQKCAGPRPIIPSSRFAISARLMEQSRQWLLTGLSYGTALAVGVCYFSEWKTVLQYVPYYNLVYREKPQPPPKPIEDAASLTEPNNGQANGSPSNGEDNGGQAHAAENGSKNGNGKN